MLILEYRTEYAYIYVLKKFFFSDIISISVERKKEDFVMPDYEKMYKTLLDGVEKAIEMLKKTELACEEIYINTANEQ